MRRPRLRLFALALVTAALTGACLPEIGTGIDQGVIIADIQPDGAGYKMTPIAAFYPGGRMSPAHLRRDTCVLNYGINTAGENRVITFERYNIDSSAPRRLSAGSEVEVRSGPGLARYDSMKVTSLLFEYKLLSPPLAVSPGDSIEFRVAGEIGQFPAAFVASRIPAPVANIAINEPAGPGNVQITWTPDTVPGSMVFFYVRGGSPVKTFWCAFEDTGEGFFDPALTATFLATNMVTAEVRTGRQLASYLDLGDNRELYLFVRSPIPLVYQPICTGAGCSSELRAPSPPD